MRRDRNCARGDDPDRRRQHPKSLEDLQDNKIELTVRVGLRCY